jgi:hypothetical protein
VTTIAITMAGRGQRFRDAGYDVPKFAIEVHGRTLFAWALSSLRSWLDSEAPRVVFIAREQDRVAPFLERHCAGEGVARYELVELTGTTDGQATTALRARAGVDDPDAPFLVYNVDTHVRPGAMRAGDVAGDGWIPVFPGAGAGWSFAAADAQGRVTELREKQRISPHATVGLYWFRSFALYADLYARHYELPGASDEAGERYIAPMYNTLVRAGRDVRIAELGLADVVPLGTPAEVERFAASRGGP